MMKKLFYIIAALALFACEKAEDFDQPTLDGTASGTGLPEVIYASMADENDTTATRTYADGKTILWHGGDEILYCADKSCGAKYVFNGEDGAASAAFDKVTDGAQMNVQATHSLGIYPYNANDIQPSFFENQKAEHFYWRTKLKYQQEQTYAPNSFGRGANLMIAAGKDATDDDLYFRNACGFLVIKLYGIAAKVNEIVLYPKDTENFKFPAKYTIEADRNGKISFYKDNNDTGFSWFKIDCSNDGNGVEVGSDREHATEFWFALPPMTIKGGIKVRVEDIYTNVTVKETTKDITITRNEIQPMAAFEVTNNNKISQLWYKKDDMTQPLQWDNAENYFGAKILSHKEGNYKENPNSTNEWMYCITFDRPLTEIKKGAFKSTGITKIVLPDALTTIGEGAFNECTRLTSITLPKNVTTIGARAFYGCKNLQSVTLSTALTTIGDEAFRDTPITGITLPETLTSIGEGAFRNVPITSITIPGAVNTIGVDAFYDCEELTSVKFNPSQTETPLKIGYTIKSSNADGPFYYSPLTSIDLDRTLVLTDGNGATFTPNDWAEGLFANKYWEDDNYLNQGTSVTLGEQVEIIQKYMFNWLPIREITIPDQVATVEVDAFDGCSKLARLTIEPSTTQLVFKSDAPFYDSPLEYINFNRPLQPYSQSKGLFEVNSDFMEKDFTTEVHFGTNMTKILPRMFADLPMASFTINGNITEVGNNAFFGCEKLTSITFEGGSSPLTMGYMLHGDGDQTGPFYDSPLAEINLNRELIYQLPYADIDEWAEGVFPNKYWDDVAEVKVTIGENVKSLSKFMFSWLAIHRLTLPGTLESVGEYAFKGCKKLTDLYIKHSELALNIKGQGNDSDGDDFDYGPFYDSPLRLIEFDRAFNYQKFNGTAYTADDDEKGIFTIDPDYKNSVITAVEIGNHVTVIPEYMFSNLPIQNIIIPANVIEIKDFAFELCTKLYDIEFCTGSEQLVIGNQNYTSNENGPFYDSPLRKISIKRDLVCSESYSSELDEWDEGIFATQYYQNDDELYTVNVYIGDNVKTISKYMFANLGIITLSIPGNVTKIEDYAFYGCSKLAQLHFLEGDQPLEIGFQPGTDEVGPFYQSPLSRLFIRRQLNPSASYAAALNNNDEGIFSSTYYNNNDYPTTKIEVLENLTTIHKYMFACSRISNITIPASVTSIENDAFDNCYKLKEVHFAAGTEDLHIGYQADGTDRGTFYDSPLEVIDLNRELVYEIDDFDTWDEGIFATQMYKDNDPTVTVTIGENVKTISKWMFSRVRMQSVEIPASVTSIGEEAFYWCRLLSHVTCKGSTAPTLGSNVFKDCNQMKAGSITIPSGSLSSYQSKWSKYSSWLTEE